MFPIKDDNPTRIQPVVTIALVAICCLAFLGQLALGQDGQGRIVYGLGLVPAALFDTGGLSPEAQWIPASLTIFTSMFLHGGLMHLAGNMLYLWIFGNNVEDAMGHVRFIVFYLLCGSLAVFAQALPDPDSTIPMIGASGAISGVLGAYLLLYPHARVLVVIPLGLYFHPVRLPAWTVLGFWFVLQIVSTLMTGEEEGGVAWGAHVGGFLGGMVLIPFFKYREVPLFHPRQPE